MMLIATFLANLFGVEYASAARWLRRGVRIGAVVLAVLILLFVVLQIRSCFSRPPKLDERQIQRAEEAIKAGNDRELREILVESDAAEARAVQGAANAKADRINAVYESRKKWENASREELQAEFDRRRNQ